MSENSERPVLNQLPRGQLRVRDLRVLQGHIPPLALPWHNHTFKRQQELRYRFYNCTDREVDCIWLQTDERHIRYGKLKRREYIDIITFEGHPWIFRDSEDGELFTYFPRGATRFIFIPTPLPQTSGEPTVATSQRIVYITVPSELISLRLITLRVISSFVDITQLENLSVPTFTKNQIRGYFKQKFDYIQEYNSPNQSNSPVVESSTSYIRNTNDPVDQQTVLRLNPEHRHRQSGVIPPVSSAPIPLPQRPAISSEAVALPQRPAISSEPVALPARPAISEHPIGLQYERESHNSIVSSSSDTHTELTVALSYPRVTNISVLNSEGGRSETNANADNPSGSISCRKRYIQKIITCIVP